MMMVDVGVTAGYNYVKQIGQVSIINVGDRNNGTQYEVHVDGQYQGVVLHHREDGAVALLFIVFSMLQELGVKFV